ncbi:MAG TPA: glycoside hydrolase family 36 protein [Candidatus Limnocylindrales bacterium]|nr:glycoside hydrolase family 36 protein [Candidatus Limnocylindrales bacterium]
MSLAERAGLPAAAPLRAGGKSMWGPEGLTVHDPATGVRVTLAPVACIDGVWHRVGVERAAPISDGAGMRVPGQGDVTLHIEGALVALRFDAAAPCTVEALGLEGSGHVPGAAAWLSNGFHSWSQTGVLALAGEPDVAAVQRALMARGDAEVVREGSEMSWWMTWAGSDACSVFAAALTADRFRSWMSVWQGAADTIGIRIVSGGSGERIHMAEGQTLWSECLCIDAGADLHAMLERYGRSLPSRRAAHAQEARAGWNSWYGLWDDGVEERLVLENARLARAMLEPVVGPRAARLHVVVDDGWQQCWGDWSANGKFPSGLSGLFARLESDGFVPGLWMAPLLAHESSHVAREHPQWFVQGADYLHAKRGRMRILDVTHEEAAAHLHDVIEDVLAQGCRYLKLDFLFAGTFEGRRARDVTGMEAYARAMRILRQAAGDTFFLAVGAPMLGTFAYADGWRIGFDIALEKIGDNELGPSWPFIANQARSIAARWPAGYATLCDADPVLLRGLARNEVEAGAAVAALAGGALFLSDDLTRLPPQRRSWGMEPALADMALCGMASRPQSPYPPRPPASLANAIVDHFLGRCDQHVPVLWKTPQGRRVAINAADAAVKVQGRTVAPHSLLWLDGGEAE